MRTRFAPTPSGYLHGGNGVNALLVSWLASRSGQIVLRIDDADQARCRPEYVEDIFRTLSWLAVRPDEGPQDLSDLLSTHSQVHRRQRYLEVAMHALELDLAYGCTCPRHADLCTCGEQMSWTPGSAALRLRPSPTGLGAVIWRRDDVPAYHLTSVVDDHDMGITHVVRGDDLRAATEVQRVLAHAVGLSFPSDVRHHDLVRDRDGAKLSKSTGSAGPMRHDPATLDLLIARAHELGAAIGITPPE